MNMETMPKLSVCVPCYGRPERTKRLINQILEQDLDRWEVFLLGDKCQQFESLNTDGGFIDEAKSKLKEGQSIKAVNFKTHYGGYGYKARNIVREFAVSPYIIFIDNDDCIKPNHFSNYLGAIQGTDYDMVYFNTFIQPTNTLRNSKLSYGRIGHAEIIVRTDLARKLPNQNPEYGHDWHFVKSMMDFGAKIVKCETEPTYMIMGVGELRETNID